MKAILITEYGGPEVLKIQDWPTPQIGENEILVKVVTTALNRADTLQRRGKYPVPEGVSEIPGLEMAGIVEEIGSEVDRWRPGDRVCGLLAGGGYAEYVAIHEDMALEVPEQMTLEDATAIPEAFLTAFQALYWLAGLQPLERVLVHAGASGVGTAAIQLAKLVSADIMVTASSQKHSVCEDLGVNLCVDYRSQDFHMEVMYHTHKYGADVILDFIGGPYFQRNLDTLALDGRMVLLGLMGGVHPETGNLAPVLRKRLSIMGSTLRNRSLDYKIRLTHDFQEMAWPKFASGEMRPVIDRVMDWGEVSEAHRIMEANENAGKIVLKVNA